MSDDEGHLLEDKINGLAEKLVSRQLEKQFNRPAKAAVVENSPIIMLVDALIEYAVGKRASDIHLELEMKAFRVRIRIDGILRNAFQFSVEIAPQVISRLKIMGGMDIAERRLPQDGRVDYEHKGRRIDLRLSTMPTLFGEKMVVRVLDQMNSIISLEELGFDNESLKEYRKLCSHPNGLILDCGATGCGKTTTLYATLLEISTVEKNVVTIEDPVEYQLDGINQMQVNIKAGLTFSNGLRAVLRQDPDIIMVGEIRDNETAEIAVRAALTGHLVFATLHTNDAAGAIIRLLDMGIAPYLVADALLGVVAQRLIRRTCCYCADDNHDNCDYCGGTGYFGRTAIYELLVINSELRRLIKLQAGSTEIIAAARKNGMKTFADAGAEKVSSGETTTEEIRRTFYAE